MPLVWTAWNNGKHFESGAGYGLKVPVADRNRYFQREWQSITLELPLDIGHIEIEVSISKLSFWNKTCHELIDMHIGQWLRQVKLAPWPHRMPPKLLILHIGPRRFRLTGVA